MTFPSPHTLTDITDWYTDWLGCIYNEWQQQVAFSLFDQAGLIRTHKIVFHLLNKQREREREGGSFLKYVYPLRSPAGGRCAISQQM